MPILNALLHLWLALVPHSLAVQGGTISVQRPAAIVRATHPLAPALPWAPNVSPFTLKSADGRELPTQWERVVQRGADGSLVSVCELLAFDAQPTSAPESYTILAKPQQDRRVKPGAWAARFLTTPPTIMLDGAPVAVAFDAGYFRSGSVAVTRRFSGRRVFGWVTVFEGQDVAHVDLVLHDAEEALPEFTFTTLAIQGCIFEPAWPEPMLTNAGGNANLAPQRTDGALKHWMGQRQARWWSGVIHDGTKTAQARALAAQEGWGVSSGWTKVGGWQAQALPLPDLSYRRAQLTAKCSSEWAQVKSALANGTPYGMGTTVGGRADIYHTWGPYYGGVTGGGDRYQWQPTAIAAVSSGEEEGVLALQGVTRMLFDRNPIALLRADGSPVVMEDYLDPNGQPIGGWQISDTDGRFAGSTKEGPFRYAVQPKPINPPPEKAWLGQFSPIDDQHFDRAFMPAVGLVWASNSPVAAWWIRDTAEVWRMGEFGGVDRVKQRAAAMQANPGMGTGAGRAHGHGWSLSAHAYAISDAAWRARWDSWFDAWRVNVTQAQMPNGLVRMHWANKDAEQPPFGNGSQANWAITRPTEESLVENSLVGMLGSVEMSASEQSASLACLETWCKKGLYGAFFKNGTQSTPTYTIGVRQVNWPGPTLGTPVIDVNAMPRDAFDRTESPSPLGSYLLRCALSGATPAPEAVLAARKLCGNAQTNAAALAWLKAQNLTQLNLDDTAPLHAALERMP